MDLDGLSEDAFPRGGGDAQASHYHPGGPGEMPFVSPGGRTQWGDQMSPSADGLPNAARNALLCDFSDLDEQSVRHSLMYGDGGSVINGERTAEEDLMEIKAKTMYKMVTGVFPELAFCGRRGPGPALARSTRLRSYRRAQCEKNQNTACIF